jgi:mannose-6-phosphate isomerase-like protein (cupin superfamily)
LTRNDTAACNLHVTRITDSERHYHKHCTEVYYILEGRGRMEIADDVIDLEPGVAVYISPNTRHRVSGDIRTIVFGVPALDPADEYFD